jgi:glycosyltransferase involved in cell wall biosynthesis
MFGWAARCCCPRRDVPYGISPRGMLHPWSFAHGRLAKWAGYRLQEATVLRNARFIHATSAEEADVVSRLGAGSRVITVPNGVDRIDTPPPGAIAAFRGRLGIGAGDFVVLFLGRLHPKKGLDTLVEAFRLVAGQHESARLVLAGSGETAYVQRLKESVCDLEAGRRVVFCGFLDGEDRRLALTAADAFALTSHSENFGLAVAEAMAAARPVVVSRTCPWPQIDEWRAGLWVDNAPADVASALDMLASNPAAAREMGENGRRAVRQHLGWEAVAGQMAAAYRRATIDRAVVAATGEIRSVGSAAAAAARSGRSR